MSESDLLQELHANLWNSLRHVFNTDRVLLGVVYISNFAAFVMLASIAHGEHAAAAVTVVAIILLNGLIGLSLRSSKSEVLALTRTLIEMYKDHGLAKYFDDSKLQYYRRRYVLWSALVPLVAIVAVALGLMIGLHS
jgi:hypothetical protein